jgi:hypothetical protein
MKQRQRLIVLGAVMLLIACLCLVVLITVSRVSRRAAVGYYVWTGDSDWTSGNYPGAIQGWLKAAVIVPDVEIRFLIYGFYARKYSRQYDAGDLTGAFDTCITGVSVLGSYDIEGGESYYCYLIDQKIRQVEHC